MTDLVLFTVINYSFSLFSVVTVLDSRVTGTERNEQVQKLIFYDHRSFCGKTTSVVLSLQSNILRNKMIEQ